MPTHPRLRCLSLTAVLVAVSLRPVFADDALSFERDIQPILEAKCVGCHSADEAQQDFRLDSFVGLMRGGNSGPAIVPGKSAESPLVDAVTAALKATAMPPKDEGERLTDGEVALIRHWIDAGAIGPASTTEPPKRVKSDHWAFQPIAAPRPPVVANPEWCRNAIDRFVLSRLEAEGLAPSPEADRATLIRRLSLDLRGLPPSILEVDAFVHDPFPDAYDRLVERFLASPHYGERWGRHWLDQARYADSNGYTIDSARSVWKYRDWVIAALNADEPFDRFATDQLAGDMLPTPSQDQLIATGFHRNTLKNEEGGTDPEQFRVEAVVDRVSTTGSIFLGLTVGCARCHDHKYDPISQREFYQLFAIFNSTDEPTLQVPTDQQQLEEAPLLAEIALVEKRLNDVESNSGTRQKEWEAKLAKELAAIEAAGSAPTALAVLKPFKEILDVAPDTRSDAQKKQLRDEFLKHDAERIPLITQLNDLQTRRKQLADKITTTLVMQERSEPRPTFVHMRGDFLRPGAAVSGGVPAVLPRIHPSGTRVTRLDFSEWLFEPENPLTARVTVNRVWQTLFGRGFVETENDFGLQGDKPTHPELLDWLATRFRSDGWSLKSLHRLIVTSAAYRQSSATRADLAESDPYNRLIGRQARLRLEAEVIRDAALEASGLLIPEIGGPGVYPPQPEGIYRFTQQVKYWKQRTPEDRFRRGVYTFFWRSSPYPFLVTFDAPDSNVACTRRARSNTPLQSLTLANDRVFVELAEGLGRRIIQEASGDETARAEHAFQLCFSRVPSSSERDRVVAYARSERERLGPATAPADLDAAVWSAVGRVMLNLDEFVTRE